MTRKTGLKVFISICFVVIWFGCAGQVPPEGGPKDLEPPEIVGIYPEPNSTNVDTDVIRFQFSKYVEQRSFQQALFISPIIDDMEIQWRGRRVELQINEPLRENTTYSVTIGTDLRDIREGTRLSDAFTLAFSTGDEIDRGQINGNVYYKDPVGVLIFAYQLRDSVMADTLNPGEQQPDYITQTGKDGSFRLPYLRFGTYRVIAILDEFQNRLYDRDVDPYGVYVNDVIITEDEPVVDDVTIRMHKPDLTKPFITRVTAIHNTKLNVRFSKPVDPQSMSEDSFRIHHKETGDTLGIHSVAIRKENPAEVYLFTDTQRAGEYVMKVDSSITDLFGNKIRTDDREDIFEGNPDDPESPVTVEYIRPRSDQRNVHPGENISLQFSYPVRSGATERAIWVVDTNEVALDGDFIWNDETAVTFKPVRLMESKMPYTIVVELDSLPAKAGLVYEDSLFTSRFTVMDRDILGTIEGELVTNKDAPFTIQFDKAGRTAEPQRYRYTRRGGGSFSMRNIPEGEYTLWVFHDPDESGEYNYGEVFPYRPSSPFVTYPDTVRVRARWTVDGIFLDMRKYDEIDAIEAAEATEPEIE